MKISRLLMAILGVEITAETALMKLDNEDQFAAEKDQLSPQMDLAHEKAYFRAKEFHGQEDIPVQEENNILKNTKMEMGSNSQHYSEGYKENDIIQSQHEIEGHKEIKIVNRSELKASDIDLERVIKEQDTYDLVCPNCRSCITKRVILRKRKRSERKDKETESDAPAKKVHEKQHDVDSSPGAAEMKDPGDREPHLFRCLSCFSFFLPTEGGFSIFRIFEKREENQNLQSSYIFESGTSKRKESESGVQLPVESSTTSEEQTGHLSPKREENMPAIFVGETAQHDHSLDSTEKNSAGSILPGESYVSSSRQMEVPSQSDKQSMLAQPVAKVTLHDNHQAYNEGKLSDTILNNDGGLLSRSQKQTCELKLGDDIIQGAGRGTSLSDQSNHASVEPAVVDLPRSEIQIHVPEPSDEEARRKNDWDVLKSIVYGGLIECITSLGVISSAAGTGASTLKIVALGLANLIGGFFVIVQNLFELRSVQDEATDQNGEPAGRYWELLGRRANFQLHATVAIISYLLAGIIPPLIYGFSFQESDNKEYKLIAVAAACLLCISLLAIGKAHVKPQKAYIKHLLLYLSLGVSASGLSYVSGLMISRLLDKLGLFNSNTSVTGPPSIIYRDISSTVPAWSSY